MAGYFQVEEKQSGKLDTMHEMAQGLYDTEIIGTTTMREYDALCLPPIQELTKRDIKRIFPQEIDGDYPNNHRIMIFIMQVRSSW